MTTVEKELIVEQGYIQEDGGVCLTALNTDVEPSIIDYAKMKDAIQYAVELYYGVKDGPVGDVWHDQQYDVLKAYIAQLEAENPAWKEQYDAGQIEYHLGEIKNG